MKNDEPYDFGEAFARLTCLLEDGAGLACGGQSPRLARPDQATLVDELSALHSTVGDLLEELRNALRR